MFETVKKHAALIEKNRTSGDVDDIIKWNFPLLQDLAPQASQRFNVQAFKHTLVQLKVGCFDNNDAERFAQELQRCWKHVYRKLNNMKSGERTDSFRITLGRAMGRFDGDHGHAPAGEGPCKARRRSASSTSPPARRSPPRRSPSSFSEGAPTCAGIGCDQHLHDDEEQHLHERRRIIKKHFGFSPPAEAGPRKRRSDPVSPQEVFSSQEVLSSPQPRRRIPSKSPHDSRQAQETPPPAKTAGSSGGSKHAKEQAKATTPAAKPCGSSGSSKPTQEGARRQQTDDGESPGQWQSRKALPLPRTLSSVCWRCAP